MDKDSNEDYRKRLDALSKIRDALETSEDFDGFISALERQGMPEDRSQRLVAVPVDADFHLHSNYSDGKIPARKLAWLARAMGLKIIGLADHDNIDGCREIYREGTLLGVSVIPGVELSTGRPGCEILV
ncbi:MAG: PHP domain-containing protein, partial [Planctomycetia bacterium]|nr:PHP domain-containing protein [Planctomycetia bacterium]